MKANAKIQKTKSNTTINIPSLWARSLNLEQGQEVELELKKDKIIIHIIKEG